MSKVSIIIPIFNVEKYLCQCLDSVIKQTLIDIEIICVNDGSTDRCPHILEDYSLRDNRIKVIHKENGGYGAAMNTGISHATGEYIGIVESDDFVKENMFEFLYNEAKKSDLQVLKTFYYSVYDASGKEVIAELSKYNCRDYEIINFVKDDLSKYDLPMPMIWSSIYKRSFLNDNNIVFNETPGASYQDVSFRLLTTYMCEKYKYIPESFYCYRIDNPNSSVQNKGKIYCVYEEFRYLEACLKDRPEILEKYKKDIFYKFVMDYHGNMINRIDADFVPELTLMLKDYIEEKTKLGWYDKSFFTAEMNEMISMIVTNTNLATDKILIAKDKVIAARNNIINLLSNLNDVVIYGAGKVGLSVLFTMQIMQLGHKISAVAVTQKGEEAELCGVPIKAIDEIENKNCLLYIAVSQKKSEHFLKEMIDTATKLGFRNIEVYK